MYKISYSNILCCDVPQVPGCEPLGREWDFGHGCDVHVRRLNVWSSGERNWNNYNLGERNEIRNNI